MRPSLADADDIREDIDPVTGRDGIAVEGAEQFSRAVSSGGGCGRVLRFLFFFRGRLANRPNGCYILAPGN